MQGMNKGMNKGTQFYGGQNLCSMQQKVLILSFSHLESKWENNCPK